MADLLHQASDDQMALAICFSAVAACGLIMYFSHHVGRLTGHIRLHDSGAAPRESLSSIASADLPAGVREKAA